MLQTTLTGSYQEDTKSLSQQLRVAESFDVVNRELESGGGKLSFYFIDGFVKDEVMEKIMEFLLKAKPEDFSRGPEAFMARMVPYVEAAVERDIPKVITAVLSGQVALVAEGITGAVLIDARTYPARGPEEPEEPVNQLSRQLRSSDRNSGLLQNAVTPASRASSSMSDQS